MFLNVHLCNIRLIYHCKPIKMTVLTCDVDAFNNCTNVNIK